MPKQQFRFITRIATEPMPQETWEEAVQLLANLVARAYWEDFMQNQETPEPEATDKANATDPKQEKNLE